MNFLGGRSFNNNTRTTHLLKYKLETQAACGGSRLSSSADRLSWPKWTLDCFDSLDFGHLGWINTVCHRPRQQKKKTAHLQKKGMRKWAPVVTSTLVFSTGIKGRRFTSTPVKHFEWLSRKTTCLMSCVQSSIRNTDVFSEVFDITWSQFLHVYV